MLADGTVLDTGDAGQPRRLPHQPRRPAGQAGRHGRSACAPTRRWPSASARNSRIKNTTGYSLNALVDFDDPIDILQHLMIGSEGTLGFISEITYRTVIELPKKASALVVFPDIGEACRAVPLLKKTPVAAVELLDTPALRAVENKPGHAEEHHRHAGRRRRPADRDAGRRRCQRWRPTWRPSSGF